MAGYLSDRKASSPEICKQEEEASQLESINCQSLGGELIDDLELHEDDKFEPPNDDYNRMRVEDHNKPKPCYFQAQEFMADLIIDRISVILQHYQKKDLKYFDKFEFQIYTVNSDMLEQQTIKRLCERQAECFPQKMFEKPRTIVLKEGKRRVNKYNIGAGDVIERHKELVKMSKDNPKTLILVVADEAHWGITHSETSVKGETANNKLVNSWTDEEHPNVLVLQVSATPFNLLTDCSRIPLDEVYARDTMSKENIVLDKNTKGKRLFSKGKDVTNRVGTSRKLHHVKWSESFEAKLQAGIIAKVKIGLQTGIGFAWMLVEESPQERFLLKGTEWSDLAEDLVLKGSSLGSVQITTIDGSLTLGILETKETSSFRKKTQLCFMETDTQNTQFDTSFTLHCRCGQDVFELQCGESYLCYDTSKKQVIAGKAPPVDRSGCLENPARDYLFVIDSLRSIDETKPGKEYLSLNSYFNTMRNDGRDRLLRTDLFFTKMCTEIKKENPDVVADDIMAAEYSYYILIAKGSQNLESQLKSCLQRMNQTDNIRAACVQYHKDQQYKFSQFQDLLRDRQVKKKHFSPIEPKVFTQVCRHLREEAKGDFLKQVKWPKRNVDIAARSSALLHLLMHGISTSELDTLDSDWTDMFQKECGVLEKSETFTIVEDLLSARHGGIGLHGHMKILRVSQGTEKIQQAEYGNRIYSTLCLARKVSSENNEYLFEVVRDYDNFKLRDQMKSIDDPDDSIALYRIRRVLQSENCQYCDLKTHQSCQCVEYLPDLPSLRCKSCSHLHKEIIEYSDLDRLPCILILDRKGRMGDTFPPSFNVMDLRLNFVAMKSTVFLSSVMQDLGRMCRYIDKAGPHAPPYALIGPKLEKVFKDTLPHTGVFYGIIFHGGQQVEVDRHVSNTKKNKKSKSKAGGELVSANADKHSDAEESRTQGMFTAAKSSFDKGNIKSHRNRLLLEAEPQIGKTGVFLNVICKLRKRIEGREEADEEIEFHGGAEDEDEGEERRATSKEELLDASEWEYPYWRFMENSSSLPTEVGDGKYTRVYGSYVYGKKPQPLRKPAVKKDQRPVAKLNDNFDSDQYKAFSRKGHRCVGCSRDTDTINTTVSISGEDVSISIPHSRRFLPLVEKLCIQSRESQFQDSLGSSFMSQGSRRHSIGSYTQRQKLKSWIFTPTYRRELDANLNLTHTMVDMATGDPVDFVQILVVRPEEFKVYCETWQSTHAILQMPNALPYENGEVANVNEGGVGFARLFIQLFSEKFNLEHIFMIDDNVPFLYEIVRGKNNGKEVIIRDTSRNVELKRVSMFKVLSDLESQMEHHATAPKESHAFEPFCQSGYEEDDCCERHSFTGPPCQYAILGIMKARPSARKIVNPFKRVHVFSLVYVNIEALKQQRIQYKPWPVFEDVNINNDCDRKGMWVCKYNRFLMAKTHLKTWLPDVYEWSWQDSLAAMKQTVDVVDDWMNPLVQWLKCNAPPKRVLPDLQLASIASVIDEKLAELQSEIRQIRCGSHLCIVLRNSSTECQPLSRIIGNLYQETDGIGGFQKHAIFVPVVMCLKESLLTLEDFRSKLIQLCFEDDTDFKVLTSHNILYFKVPMLLLVVDGTGKKMN